MRLRIGPGRGAQILCHVPLVSVSVSLTVGPVCVVSTEISQGEILNLVLKKYIYIFFAILGPLHFHIKFRISLPISARKTPRVSVGAALNLHVVSGGLAASQMQLFQAMEVALLSPF